MEEINIIVTKNALFTEDGKRIKNANFLEVLMDNSSIGLEEDRIVVVFSIKREYERSVQTPVSK